MNPKIALTPDMIEWLANGELGTSSETIFQHLTGVQTLRGHPGYPPSDPADLNRCRLLLEQCPELAKRFPEMANVSVVWARLVTVWDQLCKGMDEEAPDWRAGEGSAFHTYNWMKKLGC